MRISRKKLVFLVLLSVTSVSLLAAGGLDSLIVKKSLLTTFPTTRDLSQWPFSQNSIWNAPIGSNAEYIPQAIQSEHIEGIQSDLNIIILEPDAPLVKVYGTEYRWQRGTNAQTRCKRYNDTVHLQLPIPDNYVTTFFRQSRPNNPAIVLLPDGHTLVQTQPFQVCPGGYATTGLQRRDGGTINRILRGEDIDIYSDGQYGMHGGSGLNTLGGVIRVGELAPQAGPIRHALKISFPGENYLYYDHENEIGYRWPAKQNDSNAAEAYNGILPEAMQGALRAIPATVDLSELELETEPGRKIAWTLQNYGAYQVEGVPWNRAMIAVEEGPHGNVPIRFKEDWGYDFVTKDKIGNPWFRDLLKIFRYLHVVSNNGPSSVGGGGLPLQPLAPELRNDDSRN